MTDQPASQRRRIAVPARFDEEVAGASSAREDWLRRRRREHRVIAAYLARIPNPVRKDFVRLSEAGDHPAFRVDPLG